MRVLPSRRLPADDDGFSLVETVVALTVAALAFSSLALALISGVHSSLLSQQNQQAGDLLSQTVEKSRALGYDALAMRPTDLDVGEATRSPSISGCSCFDPKGDRTTGSGVEPLATTDAAGGIYPHVATRAQNGLTYRIRQYVTAPTDAFGATYKRLTVLVTWSSLGKDHTRSYSTVVTETRRGLPLPDYKFTATGGGLSQCRNPGSEAVYSFTLKNNGARDAWALAATGGGTWSFYEDTNASGTYDTGDANLNAAGSPTTDAIEPTAQKQLLAVASVPLSAVTPAPYTWTTTFRATSVAQPGYFSDLVATTVVQDAACGGVVATPTATPTATATATPTATPTAPPSPAASCASITGAVSTNAPGGTMVRYYLYNPSQPGNTNATTDMPVTRDSGAPPGVSSLYAYSQDLTASPGRYVEFGTAGAARDTASWTYQMPAASTVKGTGSFTMYAMPSSGLSTAAPAFTVAVDVLNSNGTVKAALIATKSYATPSSGWGCTGFRPFSVQFDNVNGSGDAIAANEKIRVTVKVTNAVPVLLAYGTSAYPSELQLPFKTGLG